MHSNSRAFCFIILSLLALPSNALNKPCPILGAYYPAPTNLLSSSRINSASTSSKTELLAALSSNGTSGDSPQLDPDTTAFSVDVYSLHSEDSLFTFHFTPSLLASQRTSGVAAVDSNTVYRIGSVSKLWTLYIYLITAGDTSWNQPITDFVPELAVIAERNEKLSENNEVDYVSWKSITVGALASHMAGIGRDAAYSASLTTALESLGLPDQGGNSHSTCGDPSRSMLPCNRTAFFEDFLTQHPVTSPFQTPIYSNEDYQILSYALENITGHSMSALFSNSFVEPLGLNGTFYSTPPTTNSSIIPFNTTDSWWDGTTLDETPASGYYSTINDMRAIGKAMLNSTLLDPAQTRRWLKPHAFTSDPNYAVGAPWEIMRAPGSGLSSWMYTKSGDLGAYAALTALLPDLGIGFSVLAAGDNPISQVVTVAGTVSSIFVPALWTQAKDEAAAVYHGTYSDEATNSSMTVSIADGDNAGLVISEWVLGGEDVISFLGSLLQYNLTVRLYPMGLSKAGDNGTTIVSWRAVFEQDNLSGASGAFSSTCYSWQLVDAYIYGGVGLDEFLFAVDAAGNSALYLESRVVGVGMAKVGVAGPGSRKMVRRVL